MADERPIGYRLFKLIGLFAILFLILLPGIMIISPVPENNYDGETILYIRLGTGFPPFYSSDRYYLDKMTKGELSDPRVFKSVLNNQIVSFAFSQKLYELSLGKYWRHRGKNAGNSGDDLISF